MNLNYYIVILSDGFSKKFHEICDNQSRTVTIIKEKISNEILGGYNPIKWKSDNGYGTTKDSFIFCFKNNDNILSRVIDEKFAVFNSLYIGPSFGNSDLATNGLVFFCKKIL